MFSHISVILIALIILGISWQSLTVVHFYVNQDEMEELFCVNKDKPELNCHAQCHLKKELTIKTVDNKASLQVNALLVFQMFEQIQEVEITSLMKKTSRNVDYRFIVKEGGTYGLLDPPKIS